MRYIIIFILLVSSGFAAYQAVRHDNTLTGEGITGSELKVDTSKIATPFDIIAATRSSLISPSQITSDQDDYNPTGWDDATIIRISGDASIRAITSFAAPTATYKPYRKTLINIGAYSLYIPSEGPDGTAANRVIVPNDYRINPYASVDIIYDETSTRWRVLSDEPPIVSNTLFYAWSPGSVTAGDWGDLTLATTGTASANATNASTTTLPAANQSSTGSTTTGAAWIYFTKSAVSYTAFASAHIWAEATISIPTLSDGTQTFTTHLQLTNSPTSTSAEPNNSIFIRYSNGINSGKFQLVSQNNAGAESTADLGVTVATATLYKLRIEIDKAKAEVRGYVNDIYGGRVTGNLPNSVVCGARVGLWKSAGGTASNLYIHNFITGAQYN